MASSLFPVAAGLVTTTRPPRWVGLLDVGFAAALVVSAMALNARNGKRVIEADRAAAFRVLQPLSIVLLVLLAAFFFLGDTLQWDVLVIGLTWRAWLLVAALPSVCAEVRAGGRKDLHACAGNRHDHDHADPA